MTSNWQRFRRWGWWWQAVAWLLVCPLPLALWAWSRPRSQRLGPALLAVASLAVWVAVVAVSAAEDRPASVLEQAGRVPTTTSRPDGTSTTSASAGHSPTATADERARDQTTTTTTPAQPTTTTRPADTTTTTTGAPETTTTTTSPTTTTVPAGRSGLLAQLRVAPEGSRAGYDRDLFAHWVDADGDRCDTREEVLIAESRTPAEVDPYGCKVVAGDWYSNYDGLTTDQPGDFDVDHVVALAEAWDSGAAGWDAARRRAFANDLDEPAALIAVSASSNRSKSDEDPTQWRPPRREAWCAFATDWVTVKVKWDLSADEAEVSALRTMLAGC